MSSFSEKLQTLSSRAKAMEGKLGTEEATKNALVMPFLQVLGYDVFDPGVVVPEFIADHGIKKGEKVDYAIFHDSSVCMLIECKSAGSNLDNVGASQLYRYFSVTESRLGVLTNGTEYRFFTDLEKSNTMDSKPFFIFDVLDFTPSSAREMERFKRESFEIDSILSSANDLKYRSLIEAEIEREIETPSDDLVELMARRVYSGRLTTQVREWFGPLVVQAMRSTLRTMVNKRLSNALDANSSEGVSEEPDLEEHASKNEEIVTTDEEIEAFQIVRAILRSEIDIGRIFMRDQKSYCGILLDNNNRKPICRLHFNAKTKRYVSIFTNKKEEKTEISRLEQIFDLSDALIKTVKQYDALPDDVGS